MTVNLVQADSTTYEIMVDDEVVGYIKGSLEYIRQINIFEAHQMNGYGTAAVQELINMSQQAGHDVVETGTVVSSPMQRIVANLGFKRIPESDANRWRFER